MPQRLASPLCSRLVYPCTFCLTLNLFDGYQDEEQYNNTEDEGDESTLCEASHKEGEERHSSSCQRIRQLGGDVVQVIALCTSRRHDGGVGDRRAMVATHGSGHAGRDRDDHELGIDVLE